MSTEPASETPILVGIADINDRKSKTHPDAAEPLTLMLRAIGAALLDTELAPERAHKLQSAIESVSVVANWTWPYPNAPELLVQRLGLGNANGGAVHVTESHHGGDSPGRLLDEAARRVAYGRSKVAVVVGAEALASLEAFKKAGKFPPPHWTKLEDYRSIWERERPEDLGSRHMLGAPTQIYPLYEAAFRAHLQQSLSDNHKESVDLYADFAQVAAKSPYSWAYGQEPETAESIGTVTKRNRMICSPYPLLMNAFNTVNLAAACIITTTGFARELGIPEEKWIYSLGGAGTSDSRFWERPTFHTSRSLTQSLDAALKATDLKTEDIDLFDFYSCFPIVPKLAAHHLNIPLQGPNAKPLTVLGGLTSFGGAGNNYSMHAITEITRQLRTRKNTSKAQNGLVLANGGVLSYHHTVILSTKPRPDTSYPGWNPLPSNLDVVNPGIVEKAEGGAVIETYTVQFGRDGSPVLGFVIGLLTSGPEATKGKRFVANVQDKNTLQQLSSSSTEQVGKRGWVSTDDGRNVFVFESARI